MTASFTLLKQHLDSFLALFLNGVTLDGQLVLHATLTPEGNSYLDN